LIFIDFLVDSVIPASSPPPSSSAGASSSVAFSDPVVSFY